MALGVGTALANGVIYTQQINNNDNLFFINSKGELKQITNHPRKDSSPIVSNDGRHVVFTSERKGWWKIWKLDLKTGTAIQLTNSASAEFAPYWSPNAQHITFVSSRDGIQDIYVMNNDGSNIKNVSQSDDNDHFPFWSNDEWIYYSSEINGTYQIVRIRSDGGSREILTTTAGNKLMPQPSPNSKQILYYGDQIGNPDIYLLDMDTKQSTNHPLVDRRPRWSADGNSIVFERGNKGNHHHIFTMSKSGMTLQQLTSSHYNYAPSFVTNDIYISER